MTADNENTEINENMNETNLDEGDTDRYTCRNCGDDLPKVMVDGPIAGDGTEYAAVELCGGCKADEMLQSVDADTEGSQ